MSLTLRAVLLILFSPAFAPAQVAIFQDGFELASTCAWSIAVPEDAPPGVTCGLATFSPALSYVDVGAAAASTIPDALTARLFRPAAAPTFVSVDSTDPLSLGVVGGGVMILAGDSSAIVLLDGLQQHPGVTLTATLDAVSLQATVRVVGAGEQPVLASLLPAIVTVAPGGSASFEVTLDLPAAPGGAVVDLSATPGLGTLPASVLVPEDQLRASFLYFAGAVPGQDTLTAFYGSTRQSLVTISE